MRDEPESGNREADETFLLIGCMAEARDGSRGKGAALEPPSPVGAVEAGASDLIWLLRYRCVAWLAIAEKIRWFRLKMLLPVVQRAELLERGAIVVGWIAPLDRLHA